MTSKYHLEEFMKWQTVGRLETDRIIIEVARCMNIFRHTVTSQKESPSALDTTIVVTSA